MCREAPLLHPLLLSWQLGWLARPPVLHLQTPLLNAATSSITGNCHLWLHGAAGLCKHLSPAARSRGEAVSMPAVPGSGSSPSPSPVRIKRINSLQHKVKIWDDIFGCSDRTQQGAEHTLQAAAQRLQELQWGSGGLGAPSSLAKLREKDGGSPKPTQCPLMVGSSGALPQAVKAKVVALPHYTAALPSRGCRQRLLDCACSSSLVL